MDTDVMALIAAIWEPGQVSPRPPEGEYCPVCEPGRLDGYRCITREALGPLVIAATVFVGDAKLTHCVAAGADWFAETISAPDAEGWWSIRRCPRCAMAPTHRVVHAPVTLDINVAAVR